MITREWDPSLPVIMQFLREGLGAGWRCTEGNGAECPGLPPTRGNSRVSTEVTMFSTVWCGYCRRLKGQMERAGIEYVEVDIEKFPAAAELVMTVNGGNQTVPTVLFADGSALANPSLAQVQDQLDRLAA